MTRRNIQRKTALYFLPGYKMLRTLEDLQYTRPEGSMRNRTLFFLCPSKDPSGQAWLVQYQTRNQYVIKRERKKPLHAYQKQKVRISIKFGKKQNNNKAEQPRDI